ncbi:hypothetical protein M422DRAFT_199415 [Sphaerobolus stellatus SS14]|nr:hypothetical protein M422DRAFT_199415 [Sphaerobolus stellatus SS14]
MVSRFQPYTRFAGIAYCPAELTANWTCGANCETLSGFIPLAAGGDGDEMQYWYVGYYPSHDTIIVSHEGLQVEELLADVTVLSFSLVHLDQINFPETRKMRVHAGFAAEQMKSAPFVLVAVKQGLAQYKTRNVTIVGHSLGAAIGLLDALFLSLQLSQEISLKFIGYGMPRVGDAAFAAYMDTHLKDLTRINNREDFVPIIPGKFMGFRHTHGEIHIDDDGSWHPCSKDDDPSIKCSTGDVSNIFVGDVKDHDGPYDGIIISC